MYKGVPDTVRGEAWKKLLGVDQLMSDRIGIYDVGIYFIDVFVP